MAKTEVNPGTLGVTVAWFVGTLSDELVIGVTFNMVPFPSVHVKGPTTAVISTPWLKARACKVLIWFCERHLSFAVKLTAHAAGTIEPFV